MQDVNIVSGSTEIAETGDTVQPVVSATEVVEKPKAGDKTDPNLLLEALHAERDKRRELEKQLAERTSDSSEEVVSDEGKLLKQKYDSLHDELRALKEDRELEQVFSKLPEIKEFAGEFEEFRKDYPRHKLENLAKLFLAEKGLLEPVRKGLEKGTGGKGTPMKVGMKPEEVENLRNTNWKEYRKLVMSDQLVVDRS